MAQADGSEQWLSMPEDLLHRIVCLLGPLRVEVVRDVANVNLVCRSWHRALKQHLLSLCPSYLDSPASGQGFSCARELHACAWRSDADLCTVFGAPLRNWHVYLVPLLFPALTSLDVSHQPLGTAAMQPLERLAGRLQFLNLSGCQLVRSDHDVLACCTALRHLALNGVRLQDTAESNDTGPSARLSAALSTVLGSLHQLTCLELAMADSLTERAAVHGSTSRTWRRSYDGVLMTGNMSVLTTLTGLSCLYLQRNPVVAADTLDLAECTALTALKLLWSEGRASMVLGPESWNRLATSLTNLQVLELKNLHRGSTAMPFNALQQLRSLRLKNVANPLTLLSLRHCTSLTSLDLRGLGEPSTPDCVVQVRSSMGSAARRSVRRLAAPAARGVEGRAPGVGAHNRATLRRQPRALTIRMHACHACRQLEGGRERHPVVA
jgi:hypothetical protein